MQPLAPFKVIIGEEVKTSEGEIIGLFLKEEIPRGLSPEETVARIRAQGGLVCIPHPFDLLRRSRLRRHALQRVLSQVDIIEVFNARNIFPLANRWAASLVKANGLVASAGSDAHTPGEIGQVRVRMADFGTPQEFLTSLAQARIEGNHSLLTVHLGTTWRRLCRRAKKRR